MYQLGNTLKGDQIRTYSLLSDNGSGPAYVQLPDTLNISNVSSGIPSSYKVGLSLEKPITGFLRLTMEKRFGPV